jgi:hypothetical protein
MFKNNQPVDYSTTRRIRQRECDSCSTELSPNYGRTIDSLLLCEDCYKRYNEHFSRCTACSYIPNTTELLKKFCTRCRGGTWLVVIQPTTTATTTDSLNNDNMSSPVRTSPNYSVTTTTSTSDGGIDNTDNINGSRRGRKPNQLKTNATRGRRANEYRFINRTITHPIISYFDRTSAPTERALEISYNGDTTETESHGSDKEMAIRADCH